MRHAVDKTPKWKQASQVAILEAAGSLQEPRIDQRWRYLRSYLRARIDQADRRESD